jgi:hypothetical protein
VILKSHESPSVDLGDEVTDRAPRSPASGRVHNPESRVLVVTVHGE